MSILSTSRPTGPPVSPPPWSPRWRHSHLVPEALRPSPLCGPLAGVWGRGHTLSTGAHGALGETAWTWSTTTQHGQGRDGAAGAWATGAAFALRGPAWEKAPQTRGRPSRVWPDEYELIGDRHVGWRHKGTVQQWEVLERHVGPECRGRQPLPPGRPGQAGKARGPASSNPCPRAHSHSARCKLSLERVPTRPAALSAGSLVSILHLASPRWLQQLG